jgi:hypothetical protein
MKLEFRLQAVRMIKSRLKAELQRMCDSGRAPHKAQRVWASKDRTRARRHVSKKKYLGSPHATIQSLLDLYRLNINPDLKVYSINLAGYGQSQVRPGGEAIYLLSGWSEKLFGLIRDLEKGDERREAPIPQIELLRSRYRRTS